MIFSLVVFTKILFKKEVVPLSITSINNRASALNGRVNMLIWHEILRKLSPFFDFKIAYFGVFLRNYYG